MTYTEEQIKAEITAHIRKNGGSYSGWYVGIAKDAEKRLFEEHGVVKNGDGWIYRQAESNRAARDVESYFVNELGTDGGLGGGDLESDSVYAYKKNSHTKP